MPLPRPVKPAYLSVRLLWAFARVLPIGPRLFELLEREGLAMQDFANPQTRIRHSAAMDLLSASIRDTGDAAIGLHAGETMESGDLDALEIAVRTCATLGDAIHCIGRYVSVMNEASRTWLEESEDLAVWCYRTVDRVPQPPAANDFALAFAMTFARRYVGIEQPALEVHVMHDAPTDEAEYARVFRAPVRYGQTRNALVFPRNYLALPMHNADPYLQKPFEVRVAEVSQTLRRDELVSKVREILSATLANDSFEAGVADPPAQRGPTPRLRRRRRITH